LLCPLMIALQLCHIIAPSAVYFREILRAAVVLCESVLITCIGRITLRRLRLVCYSTQAPCTPLAAALHSELIL
jgi:hypothetical protein